MNAPHNALRPPAHHTATAHGAGGEAAAGEERKNRKAKECVRRRKSEIGEEKIDLRGSR